MSILVVEDELEILNVVTAYLIEGGHQVIQASNGREALDKLTESQPELIILDIMIPKLDGWEVARRVREVSDIPLIMLTARDSEDDRVRGLELGADDYVAKPFSPRELLARVEAVLRRSKGESEPDRLSLGNLEIDLEKHQLFKSGLQIELTPLEFNLLCAFMKHPSRVFSRMQLLEAIQEIPSESLARTVDSHIKNLRKKIETDPQDPIYISTIYGVGYRFTPQPMNS
jgi:DNA-binding response OmpR family regulator